MALLRQASHEYKYDIDLAEVAKIWRAGCIIRAALLSDVRAAFSRNPALVNLMLDDSFSKALASGQQALRDVVQAAVSAGIPVPALGSSLAYYDCVPQPRAFRPISRRGSAISSAHTRIAASIATAFSTPTGHRHEQPAPNSRQGRSRFSIAGRAGASPRSGHHPVSQGLVGARFTSAAVSSTVGKSLRLLRHAHRRRQRDGRLSDRRSDRRARAGDGRESVLQALQARRRARSEHGDGLQRSRAGVRAPVVFYNRCNEAAALLKPGDFDWKAIFAGGVRWFHSGGIFAALSETTRGGDHRGDAGGEEARRRRVVRSELPREAVERSAAGTNGRWTCCRASSSTWMCWSATRRTCRRDSGIPGPEVAASRSSTPAPFSHDRQRRLAPSADQGRRHDAARGSLDEPPQVERGRLDGRQGVRRADVRAGRAAIASAAATDSPRVCSTACMNGESPEEALKLGWAHGALITTFPGDTTMATVEQVRAFAKGGSARIQR